MVSIDKTLSRRCLSLSYRRRFSLHLLEPLFDDHGALLRDNRYCIIVDSLARFRVEDDKTWHSTYPKSFRSGFHPRVLKRKRQPWHLTEILIVLTLVLICGKEYHFNDFAALVVLVVELDEEWGEFAARWAIVHAEVEHEKLRLAGDGRAYGGLAASSLLGSVGKEDLVGASQEFQRGGCLACSA